MGSQRKGGSVIFTPTLATKPAATPMRPTLAATRPLSDGLFSDRRLSGQPSAGARLLSHGFRAGLATQALGYGCSRRPDAAAVNGPVTGTGLSHRFQVQLYVVEFCKFNTSSVAQIRYSSAVLMTLKCMIYIFFLLRMTPACPAVSPHPDDAIYCVICHERSLVMGNSEICCRIFKSWPIGLHEFCVCLAVTSEQKAIHF